MRFLMGIVVGAIGVLALGFWFSTTGRINVAATEHGGWNDRVDHWVDQGSTRSIEKHATPASNPFAGNPAAVSAGLRHYKENCLDCHGARDVNTAEFAK